VTYYDAGIVDNGRVNDIGKLLGPLGAEVMAVLWSAGEPLSVRAVLDRLNHGRSERLAYTTVMTVLTRLAERGAATRTLAGRGYVYQPAVKDAAELAVRDVVRDHGEAAVAYFVDQARADPRLRARLERLLDDRPGEERRG
jgi:predicted transcriptional regulator